VDVQPGIPLPKRLSRPYPAGGACLRAGALPRRPRARPGASRRTRNHYDPPRAPTEPLHADGARRSPACLWDAGSSIGTERNCPGTVMLAIHVAFFRRVSWKYSSARLRAATLKNVGRPSTRRLYLVGDRDGGWRPPCRASAGRSIRPGRQHNWALRLPLAKACVGGARPLGSRVEREDAAVKQAIYRWYNHRRAGGSFGQAWPSPRPRDRRRPGSSRPFQHLLTCGLR